jgi:hypothetical protein
MQKNVPLSLRNKVPLSLTLEILPIEETRLLELFSKTFIANKEGPDIPCILNTGE